MQFHRENKNRPREMSSKHPVPEMQFHRENKNRSREMSSKHLVSEMQFHRENKNRPREMSSKHPVPVFRNDIFQVPKKHVRDPRFDDLSGTFDAELFEEDYAFIKDIKLREKQALEKELENVGENDKRRKQILFLLQRMKNQEKSKRMEEKKKVEEQQQREEVIAALKEGKKPYIPKKSEMKKKKLIETYEALKKSGKLDKYIEKRRKKIFCKDKKRFYK